MYTLALRRDFVAQHYLVGGDWGPENKLHSHRYRLEIILEGSTLDEHGYLLDLVALRQKVDEFIGSYADRTLNEMPPFAGLNPSIEHFARVACQYVADEPSLKGLSSVCARMWENEDACASYRQDL
jgi:6-pyruvoyltetrahydropterin/6-carboxytetrahydropterin synthase